MATLNGAVARAVAEAGIPAPVNKGLADLTEYLAVESGAREAFRGRLRRLLAYLRGCGARV